MRTNLKEYKAHFCLKFKKK